MDACNIKVGATYRTLDSSSVVMVESVADGYVRATNSDNKYVSYTLEAFCRFYVACSQAITGDAINTPQHYQVFPDKEAIEIIARSMTTEQFYGYCLGNFLKYRLRIGAKDEVQQELGKSNKYKELYEKHKHLCK